MTPAETLSSIVQTAALGDLTALAIALALVTALVRVVVQRGFDQ